MCVLRTCLKGSSAQGSIAQGLAGSSVQGLAGSSAQGLAGSSAQGLAGSSAQGSSAQGLAGSSSQGLQRSRASGLQRQVVHHRWPLNALGSRAPALKGSSAQGFRLQRFRLQRFRLQRFRLSRLGWARCCHWVGWNRLNPLVSPRRQNCSRGRSLPDRKLARVKTARLGTGRRNKRLVAGRYQHCGHFG